MSSVASLIEFLSGTKALSSEVNENFEDLRIANNDNNTRITTLESTGLKRDGSVTSTGLQSYATDLTPSDDKNLVPKKYVDDSIAAIPSAEGVPTGHIDYFAMSTAPTGYLKANGAAISRTTYSTLFTAIGTTYGSGDGSTTFNVPDLRGYFIRGWADDGSIDSSRVFGSTQTDQVGQHNISVSSQSQDMGDGGILSRTTAVMSGSTTQLSGQETRPVNVALLACIKY